MIDIESEVFDGAVKLLKEKYPNIAVYSETVLAPSEFPCVCIEEADNFSYLRSRDSKTNENHAEVMYEVNVYSNKVKGKKSESKEIFSIVDGYLNDLGFTRTAKNPIKLDDATKYRLFGRYVAVVSQNKEIFRR